MSGLPETYVAGFHDESAVRRMTYRKVPHLGAVSVISLGGSGFAGMHTSKDAGITTAAAAPMSDEDIWFADEAPADKAKVAEVVVASLKMGVNLIDTSHWYGQGRSERLLGHALAQVPRESYHILTKIGRYDKGLLSMFDFSYQKTYQAGKDSLRRLRCGYITSLQVHDPEFAPSVEVILEETLPALQKLKDEGVCRYIGMTGYPLALQQEIISRSPVALQTSLTYCHYTLSDTSLLTSGHCELCEQKNIALINAAALAMGLHTHGTPPDWHPASAQTKALCAQAAAYCDAKGVNLPKIAIHFTTSNAKFGSTLLSCTSIEELEKNVAAATEPLSAVEQRALTHVTLNIFKPAGPQCWHGVEIERYWQSVGKELMTERLYSSTEVSPRGDESIVAGLVLLLLGVAILYLAVTGSIDEEQLRRHVFGVPVSPSPVPRAKFLGLF